MSRNTIEYEREGGAPLFLTALFLADSINAAKDNKMVYEFDRHNKHEKRNKLEIGFSFIKSRI